LLVFRVRIVVDRLVPFSTHCECDSPKLCASGSPQPIECRILLSYGRDFGGSLVGRVERKSFCARLGYCCKLYMFSYFSSSGFLSIATNLGAPHGLVGHRNTRSCCLLATRRTPTQCEQGHRGRKLGWDLQCLHRGRSPSSLLGFARAVGGRNIPQGAREFQGGNHFFLPSLTSACLCSRYKSMARRIDSDAFAPYGCPVCGGYWFSTTIFCLCSKTKLPS
jgi:hypothetical protein